MVRLAAILLSIAACAPPGAAATVKDQSRPNILFILTQFEGVGPRVVPSNVDGEMASLARQSEALGQGPVDRLRRGEITARFVDKAIDFVARNTGRP